eukprot:Gb_22353 [translate_table: standard]
MKYPSIESSPDIVPPPTLQKVKEKRKGCFVPNVQILNDALTTQATNRLISSTTQELTTRVEELELELILASTTKEAPLLPLEAQAKLTHLEVEGLERRTIDRVPTDKVGRIVQSLAVKKVTLGEGYQELSETADVEQRSSKETTLLQQRREINSLESQAQAKKEAHFGEQLKTTQLIEQALRLTNRAKITQRTKRSHPLQDKYPPPFPLAQMQVRRPGISWQLRRSKCSREVEVGGTDKEQVMIVPFSEAQLVLASFVDQPEEQLPRSNRKEVEARKTLDMLHLPGATDMEGLSSAACPSPTEQLPEVAKSLVDRERIVKPRTHKEISKFQLSPALQCP